MKMGGNPNGDRYEEPIGICHINLAAKSITDKTVQKLKLSTFSQEDLCKLHQETTAKRP